LRLRNALALALKEDPGFSALPGKTRDAALAALEERQPADRRITAKGVYDALRLITADLVGTLVLAVDQSEEVLTLSTDVGDRDCRKAAFFLLLETLCFRRIDIRLVITLRTEYYGQFCDHFRVGPRLSVTPARGGLEQFMLHGLQDQQSLTAAIRRPTSRADVRSFGVPFLEYQFEYEPSLIGRIATDILRHCGESSALPVMQLICSDLHKKVVIQEHRHIITADDYKRAGGVEGAIEAFIDSAIERGIEKIANRKASSREVTLWKDLIATLVVRQEGGALTTQLLPRSELEAMARELRIKANPAEILNEFSAEEVRLLRRVAAPDASGQSSLDKFSLGHDALAPVLVQWREAREKIEQQKRRNRKFLIAHHCCPVK
jgi:hypothetical protein